MKLALRALGAGEGALGIGVVEHLRDDLPRAVWLSAQHPQRVVVAQLDLAAVEQLLALHLQVEGQKLLDGGVNTRIATSGGALSAPALKLASANSCRR